MSDAVDPEAARGGPPTKCGWSYYAEKISVYR